MIQRFVHQLREALSGPHFVRGTPSGGGSSADSVFLLLQLRPISSGDGQGWTKSHFYAGIGLGRLASSNLQCAGPRNPHADASSPSIPQAAAVAPESPDAVPAPAVQKQVDPAKKATLMKRLVLILLACVVVAALTLQPAEAEPSLTIGSKAPSLDIEHWVQDGDGKFEHISNFESGNVYVVEFWATWCPPCVASMPHLAELQTKYRDQKVQIISISDESLDEVEAFLKTTNPELKKSFAEITSVYSLTTDPDGSSQTDYMQAAQQNGIPTSFIVGKSGIVEWIGHPMELDEPLASVVEGTWDREAYKEEMKQKQMEEAAFEKALQQIAEMAGEGNIDGALVEIEKQLAAAKSDEYKEQWTGLRFRFKLMNGKIDDELVAHYKAEMVGYKGTPYAVGQLGFMIYGAYQNGGNVGPLAKEAIKAINDEIGTAEDDLKPLLYNTVAQLHTVDKNLPAAIAAQEKAVNMADKRQKKRFQMFLDELKAEVGTEAAEEATKE